VGGVMERKAINFILFTKLIFVMSVASAQTIPAAINFDESLLNPTGTPIAQNPVGIKLEIMDKKEICVLYSELHTGLDLSATNGACCVTIGAGSGATNSLLGTTAFDAKVFHNTGSVPPFGGCASGVNLNPGDGRALRVSYDIGAGFVTLTPNFQMTSVPYAMVA